MSRRAPRGGYEFEAKDLYRRWIWNSIGRTLGSPQVRQIAMMPSLEGAEIRIAKAKGFAEENIHVIDDNPAVVATLKRTFSGIRTYGVTVHAAYERMFRAGIRLDAANLDFTACINPRLMDDLVATGLWGGGGGVVAGGGVMRPVSCIAVTLLRGREQGETFSSDADGEFLERLNARRPGGTESLTSKDATRLALAFLPFFAGEYAVWVRIVLAGWYLSTSGQTMLFGVLQRVALGDPLGAAVARASVDDFTYWSLALVRSLKGLSDQAYAERGYGALVSELLRRSEAAYRGERLGG